jgi:hypothetical protein
MRYDCSFHFVGHHRIDFEDQTRSATQLYGISFANHVSLPRDGKNVSLVMSDMTRVSGLSGDVNFYT